MKRRSVIVGLIVVAGIAAWGLTAPKRLDPTAGVALESAHQDIDQGRNVFWAAGCAACHTAPNSGESDLPVLAGGQSFPSDFGTFIAPNISSDPTHGIGAWSLDDFANAVQRGISPDGQHYYPAFPYNAYAKATSEDIAQLYAFMKTLPADATPSQAHQVGFPFNIRRSVGGWKLLFSSDEWAVTGNLSPKEARGRYLSEGLAHCGECHTPRNALGGFQTNAWLSGGPNPNGKGTIPNITPAKLDWSDLDIANYLTTGFTPEYDTAGGHMAAVVSHMARLPAEDITAIVAYLKAVPPIE